MTDYSIPSTKSDRLSKYWNDSDRRMCNRYHIRFDVIDLYRKMMKRNTQERERKENKLNEQKKNTERMELIIQSKWWYVLKSIQTGMTN